MKHDIGGFGDAVQHVPIAEKDRGIADYLCVEYRRGILQCVQMGTIQFHGWTSRSRDVEMADRMIFDLAPDEGLDFTAVKSAAVHVRDRLVDIALVDFAMLSGGNGVHVVIPLRRRHDWAAHKDFARRFVEALSVAEPNRFTATTSKAKRKGGGGIFIDWLRNQRGSTGVLPYSAREQRSPRGRSGRPGRTWPNRRCASILDRGCAETDRSCAGQGACGLGLCRPAIARRLI